MLEEKKWNYEDRLAEEIERRTDVRGQGMQGFYANLLTKNIAMGGDVASSATSAYTAGSSRQKALVGDGKEKERERVTHANSSDSDGHDDVELDSGRENTKRQRTRLDDDDDYDDGNQGRQQTQTDVDKHTEDVYNTGAQSTQDFTVESRSVETSSNIEQRQYQSPRKKEDVVMSARERYLARKQQTNAHS